jgi:phosphoserine / homoserine phosphotransferase
MAAQPLIIATDLEGVLVPEIWIAVAERTGIADLRLTTRDLPDYDELMRQRIATLRAHRLSLDEVQAVIATLEPLPGAADYLAWLRARYQCVILSDTFYEFAAPLMAKLAYPTLFCNSLEIEDGMIVTHRMRTTHGKRETVRALRQLGFRVLAIGDSYNDTAMLAAADHGILFRPPANIIAEFPQFPVLDAYDDLRAAIVVFDAQS